MAYDLQSERELLAKRIMLIEDARVLYEIKLFVDRELQVLEEGISIEQYNAEIDQAVWDMHNGLGVSHEDLKRERENR